MVGSHLPALVKGTVTKAQKEPATIPRIVARVPLLGAMAPGLSQVWNANFSWTSTKYLIYLRPEGVNES